MLSEVCVLFSRKHAGNRNVENKRMQKVEKEEDENIMENYGV